jgi:hypothetical protein
MDKMSGAPFYAARSAMPPPCSAALIADDEDMGPAAATFVQGQKKE